MVSPSDAKTQLTDDQRFVASRLWGSTPSIALPSSGMGARPQTVEDLLAMIESLRDSLKDTITRQQAAQEELDELKGDLKSVSRVLRRMGLGN